MDARTRRQSLLPVGWNPLDALPDDSEDSTGGLPRVIRLRADSDDGTRGWIYTVTGDVGSAARRRLRSEQPDLDRTLRAVIADGAGNLLLPWIEYGDPKSPRPYLISERPGRTLADSLAERGPLRADRVGVLARTVIDALLVLHRHGRAHGLIAPQSLQYTGGGPDIRITAPLPPALAELVAVQGGTGHESPEVLRGGETGFPADVFAVASTAWTLLSGRPPFGAADDQLARLTAAEPPPLLRADVPDAMESALRAALSPDPTRRPDLATLAEALRIVEVGAVPVSDIVAEAASEPVPVPGGLPSDTERQDTLAPTRPVEDAGRPLGSRYLLDALIGRGATGHVWRGHTREDGTPVAVKLLRSELAEDPEVVTRFMRERASLMRLAHPNLVGVRDLVAEGGALAIVMDLVEGRDLRTEIASGPLQLTDAARLLSQTAAALAAVHGDGIVHRDLKPENIIVEPYRGSTRARLTDFGLARAVESSVLTRATQLVGTPAYVAPEVVAGRSPGPAVDVYAFGITAYELLAGRRPFVADSAAALLRAHLDVAPTRPEGMSDELWTLVAACLRKEPERRPAAPELAAAWARVAAGDDPGPVGVAPSAVPAARAATPPPAHVSPPPTPPSSDRDADPSATPFRTPRDPDSSEPAADPVRDELLTGSSRLGTSISERPLGARHTPEPEARSRKKLWWTLAAVVVVLGFGGGFGIAALNHDDPKPKPAAKEFGPYPLPIQVSTKNKSNVPHLVWSLPAKVASDETYVLLFRVRSGAKEVQLTDTSFPPSQKDFYAGSLDPGQCVVAYAFRPAVKPPQGAKPKPACLAKAPSKSATPSGSPSK